MNVSVLISKLQTVLEQHGDVPVIMEFGMWEEGEPCTVGVKLFHDRKECFVSIDDENLNRNRFAVQVV